ADNVASAVSRLTTDLRRVYGPAIAAETSWVACVTSWAVAIKSAVSSCLSYGVHWCHRYPLPYFWQSWHALE
ncbi:hypothetical protein OESDEN_10711, partial [Oesophagostomum dentatum]